MRALPLIIALCISSQVSLAVPILSHREPPPPYLVKTTSGNYIGHPSKSSPDVIEYFGIQYAQAPIDSLRFAAPEPFVSNETFDASEQPPDCPYVAYNWGTVPGELYSHAGRIMSQESADGYNIMSEDCLYMDIWAKSGGSAEKPVLFFVYGGGSYSLFEDPAESGGVIHIFDSDNDKGFERGSVNNPTYNGVYFAEREDVDRITMFGQSQGAWIISWYSYAFANDTIASAFIQESGSGFSDLSSTADERAAVWRNASATVGCDQAPDSRILDCMRAQNVSSVLAAMQSVPLVGAAPPFGPLIDEKLIFSNYTEKTLAGEFAQKPFLMGSNDNEAGFYVMRFAGSNQITLNSSDQASISYGKFSCPIAADANAKALSKLVPFLWRYEYFGDWPNLRLYSGSGAYHTSEVSMVFGTTADLTGEPNTPLQEVVSAYMMGVWATFARDPVDGLRVQLGWPTYNKSDATFARMGYGNETEASFVSPAGYDAPCLQLA